MDYPRLEVIILKNPHAISEDKLIKVSGNFYDNKIDVRTCGDFKNNAFFLSDSYDWIIGRDDQGATILVPLKKEGTK
jgi:hypothetical protein